MVIHSLLRVSATPEDGSPELRLGLLYIVQTLLLSAFILICLPLPLFLDLISTCWSHVLVLRTALVNEFHISYRHIERIVLDIFAKRCDYGPMT